MSTFTQFCGIDVSKDTLDYCLIKNQIDPIGKFEKIANQMDSIEDEFGGVKFDNTLFILESTGTYSAKSLHQLEQINRPISLVSPFKSKSYMSARGVTNKNDKQAAFCLALMGQQFRLKGHYKSPSMEMQRQKQLLSTLSALEKQQQMLKNQLHALDQLPFIEPKAKTALEMVLESVEAQIKPIKEQLYDPTTDEAYEEKKKYGKSVNGIGDKTATAILLATNGLTGFENEDKLSKFLGVTPHSHDSGTSIRRKGKMTKYGSSEVRQLLYMCTRSAIRYNQPCKELYQRLRRSGKPHKLAAVAVMHKLIKQFFACVTKKTLFDNDYHLKNKKK